MKKRIIAAILIAVMAVSFTGCIFGKREREDVEPASDDAAQTDPAQNPDGGQPNTDSTQSGEGSVSEGGKTVDEMIAEKNQVEPEINNDGTWYGKKKDVSAYLIIGVDQSGEAPTASSTSGGGQCDVLDLVVIDDAAKR